MIKRTLLAAAIFSALPAYAGLTSITAGYDFTDYSGDHGNRNLAYAELVAKVENATVDSICQCNTPFNYLFRCFELQCLSRSVV
ncbi:outer membrane protein [Escherichia coli]|nr:outer membrane protein [Escherichia coli]